MNREQIKKWRDDPYGATGKYGMTSADFKQLCDLALCGLEAGEPVAWGQLGLRNGKTYLSMNYDGIVYPPPPDVIRNLNLVPLYASAPASAPSGMVAVATIEGSDPYDERDGVMFSLEDLMRLSKLPKGTTLYIAAPEVKP